MSQKTDRYNFVLQTPSWVVLDGGDHKQKYQMFLRVPCVPEMKSYEVELLLTSVFRATCLQNHVRKKKKKKISYGQKTQKVFHLSLGSSSPAVTRS